MSSFAGRELLNPANVMEASYDAGTTLQQDNGLNFLGKEVDTGVRAGGEKQRQSNRTVPEPSPARSPAQTTIMAVQYDGGVIVGADSRVSTGARPRACPAARLWGVELPSLELRPYSPRLILTAPLLLPPRRVHLQPRVRQDHRCRRPDLLLPLRLRRRHAGKSPAPTARWPWEDCACARCRPPPGPTSRPNLSGGERLRALLPGPAPDGVRAAAKGAGTSRPRPHPSDPDLFAAPPRPQLPRPPWGRPAPLGPPLQGGCTCSKRRPEPAAAHLPVRSPQQPTSSRCSATRTKTCSRRASSWPAGTRRRAGRSLR